MNLIQRLFSGSQRDIPATKEIILTEWLQQQGLVPCSSPLVVYAITTNKYVLDPSSGKLEEQDFKTVQHKIMVTGSQNFEYFFEDEVPSEILNGDFRFSLLGGKYVILHSRKPPFLFYLYHRV